MTFMMILWTTNETAQQKGRLRSLLSRHLGATLLIGLAIAVGALLLFAWLADEVLAGETIRFDAAIRGIIHQYASPVLTSLMRAVTMFGSPRILIPLCLGVAAGFLIAGWRRAVVLLSITFLGAILLDVVLKLSFHRTRPVPFFDTPLPSSYSFPSGHALWSFCFYGALAAIITGRVRSRFARTIIWALAGLMILLIGISRIYLGVHYPSDVLAGYAAALVWVIAVAIGDRLLRRRSMARSQEKERRDPE